MKTHTRITQLSSKYFYIVFTAAMLLNLMLTSCAGPTSNSTASNTSGATVPTIPTTTSNTSNASTDGATGGGLSNIFGSSGTTGTTGGGSVTGTSIPSTSTAYSGPTKEALVIQALQNSGNILQALNGAMIQALALAPDPANPPSVTDNVANLVKGEQLLLSAIVPVLQQTIQQGAATATQQQQAKNAAAAAALAQFAQALSASR